jgi:hypothetical protein
MNTASSAVRNGNATEHSPDAAREPKAGKSYTVLLDSRTSEQIERSCAETPGLTPEIIIASMADSSVRHWLDLNVYSPDISRLGNSDGDENKAGDLFRSKRLAKRRSNEKRGG